MLENAENLISPGDKRNRPTISYRIEEGSVKHVFRTSMQHIIGFNAIIGRVKQIQNIDFLDIETARAFESIQDIATKKNYTFHIGTSLDQSNEMGIDKTTRLYRKEAIWVDAELYFYGKITNAGGKGKTSLHILTDQGTLVIQTPLSFFENLEENIIHKRPYGVRASGKQHTETGEIDTSTLKFIELVDYQPKYDEQYLNTLREEAKKNWLGEIDPDKWLREIRGGNET